MKHYLLIPVVLVMAIIFLSCDSLQEPSGQKNYSSNNRTRSFGDEVRPYSLFEVINIADNTLSLPPSGSSNRDIEPILVNDNTLSSSLVSDTVAYIINYGQEDGFVIVANDRRLTEPSLAYSPTGHFDSTNPSVKVAFLDRIETYLASLESDETQNQQATNSASSPVRRFIIEPQINLPLGCTNTFNEVISNNYSEANVSTGCIAMATLLTYCKDTLVYHNYYYDFPKIANDVRNRIGNALTSQNELNYTKPDNPPTPVNPPTPGYIYFLDGIQAYNQLLYNLGEDSSTTFSAYASQTHLISVYNRLLALDISLTSLKYKNFSTIIQLLNDEYFVEMWGLVKNLNGTDANVPILGSNFTWIVDGCNVMVDSNGSIIEEGGMLHCVWGHFGLGDGYYSYPVLLQDDNYKFSLFYYWGAK